MICKIDSDQIERHWAEIEPFLQFEQIEWTPEYVKQELMAARAQLFCLAEGRITAIVITQIIAQPRKYGFIWIASGSGLHEGIAMLLEHIEPWLWSQGCEFIQVIGRDGWKILPGYKPGPRIFVKVKQ